MEDERQLLAAPRSIASEVDALLEAAEQALARARATHLLDGGGAAAADLSQIRGCLEQLIGKLRLDADPSQRRSWSRRILQFRRELSLTEQLLAHGAAFQAGWAQVLEAAIARDRTGAAYGPSGNWEPEQRQWSGTRVGWEV